MVNTIDYYNRNVKNFIDGTVSVDFTQIQDVFLKFLPKDACILDFEGERNGRYFTDMTEISMKELLENFPELNIEKQWITGDVRPGRGDERWLNIILRK